MELVTETTRDNSALYNDLKDLNGYGKASYTISKVNAFFPVKQLDPIDQSCDTEILTPSDTKYFLRNDQTQKDLGTCGKNFRVVQPYEAVDQCREILSRSNLDLTGIKETIQPSPKGDMLKIEYKIPGENFVTPGVQGYTLPVYGPNGGSLRNNMGNLSLLCLTSVNGVWAFQMFLGFEQWACLNSQIMVKNAVSSYHHKHDQRLDLKKAGTIIANSGEVLTDEIDLWHKLSAIKLDNLTIKKLFMEAASYPKSLADLDDSLKEKGKSGNRAYDYLSDQMRSNYGRAMGNTAWAAYNTITHWVTHAGSSEGSNLVRLEASRRDHGRKAIQAHLLPLAA